MTYDVFGGTLNPAQSNPVGQMIVEILHLMVFKMVACHHLGFLPHDAL